MNRVKEWVEMYESGQEVRIGEILISLYAREDWHELHIALWTWLSIDGERETWDWFKEFGVPEVEYYSFPCEMASRVKDKHICSACPIEYDVCLGCVNGLHDKWVYTHKLAEREKLAGEIANMEWHGQK